MQDTEAELRGRLAMLETLLSVTIAHVATLSDRPGDLIRQIMANTEDMLERASEAATSDDERRAAEFANLSFDAISDAMVRHLT